jgi:hypothetical protein
MASESLPTEDLKALVVVLADVRDEIATYTQTLARQRQQAPSQANQRAHDDAQHLALMQQVQRWRRLVLALGGVLVGQAVLLGLLAWWEVL